MSQPPPSSPPSGLAELYRFAVLLTGEAPRAEEILAETLAEAGAHLDQVRSETGRQAWLVQAIRERCLKNNGAATPPPAGEPLAGKIDGLRLAARFHTLPEPERSALAIFYLDFFTIAEIAELLKMDADTLADTLADARKLLAQALGAAPEEEPLP